MEWGEARKAGRIGQSTYCMCFACAEQFELDLGRDVKRCPECGCLDVRSAHAAIGCRCPKCNTRVFHEETTGIVS